MLGSRKVCLEFNEALVEHPPLADVYADNTDDDGHQTAYIQHWHFVSHRVGRKYPSREYSGQGRYIRAFLLFSADILTHPRNRGQLVRMSARVNTTMRNGNAVDDMENRDRCSL